MTAATVAVVTFAAATPADAHAALRRSTPAAGGVVELAPTAIQLTFSEPPEASLSVVTVADEDGARQPTTPAVTAAGDPLTLMVAVDGLHGEQVYRVTWRAISRVDGHPTSGTFDFGVGVLPSAGAFTVSDAPRLSWLEVLGRWMLLAGLVLIVGVAAGAIAGFGGTDGRPLGVPAWLLAAAGLVALAEAQRRNVGASYADLLPTEVGRTHLWRTAAVAVAGFALFARGRRATLVAGAAAAVAMGVHVAAGHAAAPSDLRAPAIAVQWTHLVAIGVWLGGLVALLLAIRGDTPTDRSDRVHRYSRAALVAFTVLVASGVVAGVREIKNVDELTATSYGRAVVAKAVLVMVIAALAAVQRWRNLARIERDARPLRRTAAGETTLAIAALVLGAMLAGLSPPAVRRAEAAGRLVTTGHDAATSLRVDLTTTSRSAGANHFTARVRDYDSRAPIDVDGVDLRFTSLDDPSVAPTTLRLRESGDGSYAAFGNDLAFDARWRIDARVDRGGTTSVVPMSVHLTEPIQELSELRVPGEAPVFTVQIADETDVRFRVDPGSAGESTITIYWLDVISSERTVEQPVLTVGDREQVVRRLSAGTFEAKVRLPSGPTRITATSRATDGTRLRAAFDLEVRA